MNIPDNAVPDGFTLIAIYFFLSPGISDRHGLSDEGAMKVRATSQYHLGIEFDGETISPKIQFLATFHGERPDTRDSVLVALRAIRHPTDIKVLRLGAFEIAPLMSGDDVVDRARDILHLGMTAMLGQYSGKTAGDATVPTFLVGYLVPYISFAADNMDDLGRIDSAEIVVYYVSRSPNGRHYFHAVHLPCPLHE